MSILGHPLIKCYTYLWSQRRLNGFSQEAQVNCRVFRRIRGAGRLRVASIELPCIDDSGVGSAGCLMLTGWRVWILCCSAGPDGLESDDASGLVDVELSSLANDLCIWAEIELPIDSNNNTTTRRLRNRLWDGGSSCEQEESSPRFEERGSGRV